MQHILIVKTSAIGDVIQSLCVLEYLKKRFPQAQIDWVVEKGIAPLLRAHPFINQVLEVDTKLWRKTLLKSATRKEMRTCFAQLKQVDYDAVFDLQGNAKSALFTALAKSKIKVGFDRQGVKEILNLLATNKKIALGTQENIRSKYLRLVQGFFQDKSPFTPQGERLQLSSQEQLDLQSLLQEKGKRPRMMICFGSKWKNKRLPQETWVSFLKQIAQEYNPEFVFVFGSSEEKVQAEALSDLFSSQIVGNLSLPLWQAVMGTCDLIISVDSAGLALAGTLQIPSFSLFGPSRAAFYRPLGDQHQSHQGSCPYAKVFVERCSLLRTCSTGACMRNLCAKELFVPFKEFADRIARLHKNLSVGTQSEHLRLGEPADRL